MLSRIGIPDDLLMEYIMVLSKIEVGIIHLTSLNTEKFEKAFKELEKNRTRIHNEILKVMGKTREDVEFHTAFTQEVMSLLKQKDFDRR